MLLLIPGKEILTNASEETEQSPERKKVRRLSNTVLVLSDRICVKCSLFFFVNAVE